MPTYEYRCPSCGADFEKFQRMSDQPGAECPECGAAAERRMSAGAGLLFKGSGFYITDHRSESYKKAAGSEAGASSAADGGKGGDAKPAKGGSEGAAPSKAAPKAE